MLDTLYIPGFHTNIVSSRRLMVKELYWNQKTLQIEREDVGVLQLLDLFDQFVGSYVPVPAPETTVESLPLQPPTTFPVSSTAPITVRPVDAALWHRASRIAE